MDPLSLGDGWLLYGATFAYALVSGLVPVVNVEIFILALAAFSRGAPLPLILLVTTGQTLAKYILYLAGRGLIKLPPGRVQGKIQRARDALERHPKGAESVILFSAVTGLPPFYGMSLAAGALRMPLPRFLVPAILGRLARFSAFFFAPQLLRAWL